MPRTASYVRRVAPWVHSVRFRTRAGTRPALTFPWQRRAPTAATMPPAHTFYGHPLCGGESRRANGEQRMANGEWSVRRRPPRPGARPCPRGGCRGGPCGRSRSQRNAVAQYPRCPLPPATLKALRQYSLGFARSARAPGTRGPHSILWRDAVGVAAGTIRDACLRWIHRPRLGQR